VRLLLTGAALTGCVGVYALAGVADAGNTRHATTGCGAPAVAPVTISHGTGGLDAAALHNAGVVIATVRGMELPDRAAVIVLATARQESTLHNLANRAVPASLTLPNDGLGGDHDSVGILQQRPSQGWGTVAQLMDVATATRAFLGRLVKIPGWQTMPVTRAAQAVQRSATPNAYARWQPMAEQLVAQAGVSTVTVACSTVGAVSAVSADARSEAAAILQLWGTRIVGNPAARQDVADTASGRGFESCGHHISLDADVLHWQRLLTARYALTVVNYATGHGCDPYYHPPGMASDLGGVTELATKQSTNFTPGTAGDSPGVDARFDDFAASVGPDQAALGQRGYSAASSPAYLRIAFPDAPTHRHMNTHQGQPQWGPYAAEKWPS